MYDFIFSWLDWVNSDYSVQHFQTTICSECSCQTSSWHRARTAHPSSSGSDTMVISETRSWFLHLICFQSPLGFSSTGLYWHVDPSLYTTTSEITACLKTDQAFSRSLFPETPTVLHNILTLAPPLIIRNSDFKDFFFRRRSMWYCSLSSSQVSLQADYCFILTDNNISWLTDWCFNCSNHSNVFIFVIVCYSFPQMRGTLRQPLKSAI